MPPGARDGRGVVLALGGGGARGLAHIGVLQVLAERRIPIKAVVGTSVGAEIGAFLAAGMPVEEMVSIATSFDWRLTLQLFFPDLGAGGLVSGKRIRAWLDEKLGRARIEELPIPFAAVATDLKTGEEVVLDRGSLVDAVRASVSMPGTLAPVSLEGRLLVDGGVVNQVPADVARRLHGGPVLAVATHAASQPWDQPPRRPGGLARLRQFLEEKWPGNGERARAQLLEEAASEEEAEIASWSAAQVIRRAAHLSQAALVELRLAAAPPDLLLVPDVRGIGLLEFYSAAEAVEAGRAAALAQIDGIEALLPRAAAS